MSSSGQTSSGNGHDSREIQRNIERTRMEMDHTLEEISERLHPRHLVDVAIDFFRASPGEESSPSREYAQRAARTVGKQVVRTVREHPVPALLCGAGIAWLLYEELEREEPDYHSQWADIPEHSGSFVDARTGQPYSRAAWSEGYDWAGSHEDEQSWAQRAEHTLAEIRDSILSAGGSAQDKVRKIARKMVGLSGRTREEIHSQWANLNEHSGSYVDARTGEPYGSADDYACECDTLYALDTTSSMNWSSEEEESWKEKAQHALEEMQQMLSDTGTSVKDRTRALASKLSEFSDSTRGMAAGYGRSMGRGARRMGRGAQRMGRRVGTGARMGAVQAGRGIMEGYDATCRQVSRAADEYPLAVGAACLGLGMLFGVVLPRTRREDELMGETSDHLKQDATRRARDLGQDAMERAKHVATATAEAAQDELERQGLSRDDLMENAKDMLQGVKAVAARAAETAKEVAAEETGGVIAAEAHEVESSQESGKLGFQTSPKSGKTTDQEMSGGGSCDISGRV